MQTLAQGALERSASATRFVNCQLAFVNCSHFDSPVIWGYGKWMTRWRRALAPLAVLWLSCQLTTVAFAFYASDCSCAQGTAATCPMHHRTTSGSKTCGMTGLNENSAFVFDAVVNPIGFTTSEWTLQVALDATSVQMIDFSVRPSLQVPPDSPPPRA